MKASCIGFELQENIASSIDELSTPTSHLQVTIPNFMSYPEIKKITDGKAVILHSNLLNVLGKNSFNELERYIPQIQSLRPLSIVEHLSQFVDESETKQGVQLPKGKGDSEIIMLAKKNIEKWQSLLGKSIALCLENVIVTENVIRYFSLLRNIQMATGCHITIDVPHFIISYFSLKDEKSKERLIEIVNSIYVKHIHLAGISKKGNKIDDNHSLANFDLVLKYANKWFPNAPFVTIEQGPLVSPKKLKRCLDLIKSNDIKMEKEDCLSNFSVFGQEDINKDLAQSGLSNFIRKKGMAAIKEKTKNVIHKENPFYFFEKYQPFFYPIASLRLAGQKLDQGELLLASSLLAKWGLNFSSWANPHIQKMNIVFGQEDEELFSKGISSSGEKADTYKFPDFHELTFQSNKNYWVKIQIPKI